MDYMTLLMRILIAALTYKTRISNETKIDVSIITLWTSEAKIHRKSVLALKGGS